jgi:glycosyltransferase involved in cell wall biosynthesis
MRLPSLILCEDVRKEIMGTHTIVGQFNALRGYLMEKYTFKVFFMITDFVGMAKLKVVVRSPEGVELKKFYTDDIPCTSRQDCSAGYFTVTDLFLRSYGRYSVSISDMSGKELSTVGINYLVHDFKTNKLMIGGKPVEVPRVNIHDNRELPSYAKLFLRKYSQLERPFESVEFHSQFMFSDGIGSVSCHLINQMIKRGVKVKPVPIYTDQNSLQFIKDIPKESVCRGEADVTIVNTLPPHLKNASNAKRLLLFSYWEVSKIDKSWVNVSNTVDGVFVPSHYVKDVYKDSGVKVPVLVYKQPIDTAFKYADKKTTKEDGDKEYFDILFLGTCIPRKGYDIFTRAIDKVFGKDKKVRIRMHMKPWSEAYGDARRKVFKDYEGNNQYLCTSSVLSTLDIVKLLQSSDLLVAPSRSEGLGLTPIQSVVCGTPAIVPNHTGFKEYNNKPGFLKIEKNEVVKGEGIYADGTWFEPDFDELCELLAYARKNRERLFEDAKRGSAILSEEYGIVPTYTALESLINNIYVK